MPQCRNCSTLFDGPYRQRYCSTKCQFLYQVPTGLPADSCWDWQGATTKAGYGVLNIRGVLSLAHRMSYEFFVGEIPDSRYVCHTCDNPSCVNPRHLFAGTNADNMADMAAKGRAAWKNKALPAESRKKIAASRKASGWKPSAAQIEASKVAIAIKRADPAWVEAQSAKLRGPNNPNFGKSMSPEQRAKMQPYWDAGGNAKGVKRSEETKQKMRLAAQAREARKRATKS